MSVNEDHFRQLLDKYANKQASPEELEELFALIKNSDNDGDLQQLLVEGLEDTDPIRGDEELWDKQFDQMLIEAKSREIAEEKSIRHIGWRRLAVAASIIIGLSVGSYILLHKEPIRQVAQNQPHDIAPGRNQATLTLAGGQKIILTKGLSGKLAQQGNTLIQVNGGNAITYTVGTTENNPTTKVEYNTLTTVRGEQSPYPLVLADGTKVWLDAASSITYPTAFNGNERVVTVTGEAYFEVAHNASHPFKVKIKNQIIEDIGTAFNINAYDDEPQLKTTLIEGSVKISNGSSMVTLRPGQQAAGNALKVEDVDTESVIAWKNNYFLFEGDNLESIMRKVSRWYDVDVVYQYNGAKTKAFGGTISRYKTVNSVLKKLEMTGAAHFQLNGKTITVTQ